MGIDLSSALHDLARSVGDDAATDRMSALVHHMVSRVKRRRAARTAATGIVGVGAVGAVAIMGPFGSRPQQDPDGDLWGTGLAIGACGSPAPMAPADLRGLHFDASVGGATTVPVGGPLELDVTLVNDSPDAFRAGTSPSPSAVVVQDGVVVGQGDPMIDMLMMVDLAPGERLEQRLFSSLTACEQDGTFGDTPLPPGDYEVYAMQVFHPDSFMEVPGPDELLEGGTDGGATTEGRGGALPEGGVESPLGNQVDGQVDGLVDDRLEGAGATGRGPGQAPATAADQVDPLPGTVPQGGADGGGTSGAPGTGTVPPDLGTGELPPDVVDPGVPTSEPVTVVGGPWTITIDGSLPTVDRPSVDDPDSSVSWPPVVDPVAEFPACHARVPSIHELPPTLLTVVTDVPEALPAGEPWEFTASVGTTDGRTVIANLAEYATLLLTLDGVVVGHMDVGDDAVAAEVRRGETLAVPGRVEPLACSPVGDPTPLPPGEYTAFTVLPVTPKEVTTADGQAYAPPHTTELAVSNPTLVRVG